MEQQATWLLSKTGKEIGGCCVQASPRDYARLGVFILNGAQANGQSIVPEGWWAEATTKRATLAARARLWLPVVDLHDDGSYAGPRHLRLEHLHRPQRKLVIVSNANWAHGREDPRPLRRARELLPRSAAGD